MSGSANHSAALATFVQHARQLYSLPAVALRILELTRSPSPDVREILSCMETDPALVSKLLRVVNSSLFGLTTQVSDLKQAVALLGIERLKLIVLGFSLPTTGGSAIEPRVLERYWRHALIKSVAARELAIDLCKQSGDDALIAGLLQDIGILVLMQDLGNSYAKFLVGVWEAGSELRSMETEVLGFDHVELSAQLMSDWRLPESLVEAVGRSFSQAELMTLDPSRRALPQVLHLAEFIARFILNRDVQWLDALLQTGNAYAGMTTEQLRSVLMRLEKKAPQLAAALSIPWNDDSQFACLIENVRQQQRATIQATAPAGLLQHERTANELATAVTTAPRCDIGARGRASRSTALTQPPSPGLPPPSRPAPDDLATNLTLSLCQQLGAIVTGCRQSRAPVSLALVQLDDADTATLRYGEARVLTLLNQVESLVAEALDAPQQMSLVPLSTSRVAVILAGVDRRQAITVGRDILDGARRWSIAGDPAAAPVTVSVGLASLPLPPRNFPVDDMVQAAERCLYGVQLSGGDGVKSIEIC